MWFVDINPGMLQLYSRLDCIWFLIFILAYRISCSEHNMKHHDFFRDLFSQHLLTNHDHRRPHRHYLWCLGGSDQRCFTNFGGCLTSWFGSREARREWGVFSMWRALGPKVIFDMLKFLLFRLCSSVKWCWYVFGLRVSCAGTGVLLSTLHKDSYNALISLGSEVCISDPTKSSIGVFACFWGAPLPWRKHWGFLTHWM